MCDQCDDHCATSAQGSLLSSKDTSRALVIEVAQPGQWQDLSIVWKGVQEDLAWPAPAIAVSGSNGYQLWFSVSEPVAFGDARVVLDHFRRRYLSDVSPELVKMWPIASGTSADAVVHAEIVPRRRDVSGHWSAFVAPDLASVFSEEPWLDREPGSGAQADVLSRIQCIEIKAFRSAVQQATYAGVESGGNRPQCLGNDASQQHVSPLAKQSSTQYALSPEAFLNSVMNDAAVELHLRIEAAKALMGH